MGYIVGRLTIAAAMKTQILHFSKLQSAKVMAVLYLVLSIPLTLIALLPPLLMHQPVPWSMLLIMPIAYTLVGFVFTFLGAWIYNGVAAKLGGIEITVAQAAGE
jgi:hypothetical protein